MLARGRPLAPGIRVPQAFVRALSARPGQAGSAAKVYLYNATWVV